jgi:hypothetical protein
MKIHRKSKLYFMIAKLNPLRSEGCDPNGVRTFVQTVGNRIVVNPSKPEVNLW